MRREVIKKHTKEGEALGSDSLPRVRKVKACRAGEGEELIDLPLRAGTPPTQRPLPFASPEPELRGDEDEAAEPREPKRKKPAPAATVRGNFVLPPASILDEPRTSGTLDKARLFEKAKTLQAKSGEFGVMGSVVEIHPGPVVTTYEFKPDAGVKYSKIVGLADDLALALEAESIRIDRMSGRGTVGIEIPNEVRETIYLREIVESDAFRNPTSRLTLGLGKTVSGDTYVTDLTAMPHLLIAGSTGTGKSVGLNCMIASILLKATPDEVRMILIDPKRLELGVYEDIPHLLTPVVTDPKIAANVLKWAVGEMEKRIRRLASEGVRNIEQFNNLVRAEGGERTSPNGNGEEEELKPIHYIVIVIDELADLMMVSSHEVEESITRLASYLRKTGKPAFDESVGKIERTTESAEVDEKDELFDEAARFVVSNGQASTSMLQRRFRIGFSRAGRLVDMMEREGIVGPADGSKPREILVAADYYETVDHWPK